MSLFSALGKSGKSATSRLAHWEARAGRLAKGKTFVGKRSGLSRFIPGRRKRLAARQAAFMQKRIPKRTKTIALVQTRRRAKRTAYGSAAAAGVGLYGRYRYNRKMNYGY